MAALDHNTSLRQEVPPLFVSVASLEGLDGHADLSLAWHLQAAAADLPELACKQFQNAIKGAAANSTRLCVFGVEGVDFQHRSGSLVAPPPLLPLLPAATGAELMAKWTY